MSSRIQSSHRDPGAESKREGRSFPLWEVLGRQLRRPTGLMGALVGRFMTIVNQQPIRLAIEALAIKPKEHVIELGFGSGASLGLLIAKASQGRVAGVDHSRVMHAQAERGNRDAIVASRLELVNAPFGDLPWADQSFDKALLVNVLYFFDEGGRDIAETYRVLRPGGQIAIYVTHRQTMKKWPFSGAQTHILFEEEDVFRLLQTAGFGNSDIRMQKIELPFGILGIVATAQK